MKFARASTPVFVEFRAASFHARTGSAGVDLPVEREADGRLTPASSERITVALKELLAGKALFSRVKLCCALGSRGLILRPISLPSAAPDEVTRLLQLQIESEFPLPPDELAWGWIPLPEKHASIGASGHREVLIGAVRKSVIDEHVALLKPLGAELLFTPAALARTAPIPPDQSAFAMLDLGSRQSELTLCESGVAPSVRLIPWGENRLFDPLADRLGKTRNEVSALLASFQDGSAGPGIISALNEAVAQLNDALPASARTAPLWISGPPVPAALVARLLTGRWGAHPPRVLEIPQGPGCTAAISGMARSLTPTNGSPAPSLLSLQTTFPSDAPERVSARFPRRSLAVAAALLAVALALPYLEALLFKPRLARRLAALKADDAQLATIDRELSFLRFLEQHQAPHLDATYVIAQAAPPGTRVETVSINRQGEVALTGFLRDLAQVGDFRLKLINSGFFSTVVIEDQSPTPDRQRINFRMTARWKDPAERESLSIGPVLPNPATNTPAASNAAPVSVAPKPPTAP